MKKKPNQEKGTTVWGLNRFRSFVLPALILDLKEREIIGLVKAECDLVTNSLKGVVDTIDSTPSGTFLKDELLFEMKEFYDLYVKWNGPKNSDPYCKRERIKHINLLQRTRDRIAKKIGANQGILSNQLDEILVLNFYNSLGELIQTHPEIFSNLSKSINLFRKMDRKYGI